MPTLRAFLLRVLIWLPICFAAWYFSSILYTPVLAALSGVMLTSTLSNVFERIVADGNQLVILTHIRVLSELQGVAAQGELSFEINPLKYGYGIALYTALLLATPMADSTKAFNWLLGVTLLTLAQCAGIAAEAIKIVAFQLGPEATAQLAFPGWALEALALSYQVGYLIVPPVLPALIWLWQAREVLATMTGWQAPAQNAQG